MENLRQKLKSIIPKFFKFSLELARTVWTWHKWVQAVKYRRMSAPWDSTLNSLHVVYQYIKANLTCNCSRQGSILFCWQWPHMLLLWPRTWLGGTWLVRTWLVRYPTPTPSTWPRTAPASVHSLATQTNKAAHTFSWTTVVYIKTRTGPALPYKKPLHRCHMTCLGTSMSNNDGVTLTVLVGFVGQYMYLFASLTLMWQQQNSASSSSVRNTAKPSKQLAASWTSLNEGIHKGYQQASVAGISTVSAWLLPGGRQSFHGHHQCSHMARTTSKIFQAAVVPNTKENIYSTAFN